MKLINSTKTKAEVSCVVVLLSAILPFVGCDIGEADPGRTLGYMNLTILDSSGEPVRGDSMDVRFVYYLDQCSNVPIQYPFEGQHWSASFSGSSYLFDEARLQLSSGFEEVVARCLAFAIGPHSEEEFEPDTLVAREVELPLKFPVLYDPDRVEIPIEEVDVFIQL